MQSFLEYIIKISKNAVLRPFRLLYRQIRKRLFLKNRVGRFIKGAVKGVQKSAMYKPDSKAAYVKVGRRYLSKRFLIIVLLILVLLPIGFGYFVMPWAAGKLFAPTYAITDERVKGFSGRVLLVSNTGRNLYSGEMKDGFAEGFGVLYDKEGYVRYEGDLKQDMFDGQGKLYSEDALVYEGSFSVNLFEGRGKVYYENGATAYDGNFAAGAYDGEGKLYRPDGTLMYKGDFQTGLFHGFGIELNENGEELYEGTYELGKRSGQGQMFTDSGATKYDGGFANGLPSGEGLMYHDNGRLRYKGSLDQGVFDGAGKLYTQEGRVIYEGGFVGGAYDGTGELYRPNGRTYYEGGFRTGLFEGEGKLLGVLGNTLYEGGFHRGEFDIVPLVGMPLSELGNRFGIAPQTVPERDDGVEYVIDYDDFSFSVRSTVTDQGPVISGFVFYGVQNYLDINSGDTEEGIDVQVQGPQIATDWINPWTEYDWIMKKDTPLLDKDGASSYSLETYEYEGLLISITRNMSTREILLYEIGVVSDE